MSLADVIAEATEAHQHDGVVDRNAALGDAFGRVRADPELADQCIRSDLVRRIKERTCKAAKRAGEADARAPSLFGLRNAYALDDDAHDIKDTDQLSRAEFQGLVNLRQRQVNADIAQLTKLREALRQTADIWDRHPAWTWGQVAADYAQRRARAA